MLIKKGIDRGARRRARMGVESIFGQVRYKKREAIASLIIQSVSNIQTLNSPRSIFVLGLNEPYSVKN